MNELSEITAVLHSGELYDSGDSALLQIQSRQLDAMYDFNNTRPSETARRLALLKEMLAEVGEGSRRGLLDRAALSRQLGRRACAFRPEHLCQFQPDPCR